MRQKGGPLACCTRSHKIVLRCTVPAAAHASFSDITTCDIADDDHFDTMGSKMINLADMDHI